mmetsp:Transcript_94467/g.244004  ORF Transcript_94467/g.244004 Transcript_94467/m.244004 type:complete len:376 (-) Transcript_94467:272-1399(-)
MPDEGGRLRLVNPLSVRFSQPRIAPHFRDGHLLDEAVTEVYEAALESVPLSAYNGAAGGRPREDAADGVPPYDLVLIPPFPAIRVISWLPKIRRPDGEAERDINGDQILGKRAWFALDNRRLHAMQCAAAKRWPRRCCVVVRCIEEVPGGQTIRELRKFRTTVEGKSIDVGVRAGECVPWAWVKAAPPGAKPDHLSAEGLFAEDLHDACDWAPRAVAAASSAEDEEEPGERTSGSRSHEKRISRGSHSEPADRVAGGYPQLVSTGPAVAGPWSVLPTTMPMMAPQAQPQARLNGGIPKPQGRLAICPPTGWQYVDPAGKIQGPFVLEKMRLWHLHGFFYPDLPMRADNNDAFVSFAELWPAGTSPFESQMLRYRM